MAMRRGTAHQCKRHVRVVVLRGAQLNVPAHTSLGVVPLGLSPLEALFAARRANLSVAPSLSGVVVAGSF